jgi:hypothetical protein
MIPAPIFIIQHSGHVGSFTAIASPSSVSGVDAAGTVTSNNTIVTPSGGTAPYTYLWSYVSGNTSIVATAGTSATTAFSAILFGGDSTTGSWKCKVTDATAAFIYSNIVYITLRATRS